MAMTDQMPPDEDAHKGDNSANTPDRNPKDRPRKPHQGAPDSSSSQQAQDEQDRQLESGEENPT
jgi:hypothetical protein